jgi:hypothetical protein
LIGGVIFPPGVTLSLKLPENNPEQSNLWRETSFAFHLLKTAINPSLPLKKCVLQWNSIGSGLAEGKRKRTPQLLNAYLLG